MSRGLGCGSPECSNEKGEEGQPGEIESKELSILPLHPGWSRCPSSDPVYTRLSPGGLGEVFNKIRRAGKRGAWNHSWLQNSVPLSIFHQSLSCPAPRSSAGYSQTPSGASTDPAPPNSSLSIPFGDSPLSRLTSGHFHSRSAVISALAPPPEERVDEDGSPSLQAGENGSLGF